ncbi:methyl-accepting chemotaxis protein [bacterium BFN5]|nr:methyl-accepting chemotaxis protein [bacterium BFN5]QJW45784.1 methyl-accepting chemotaxis protein [bacterium BFN5]
MINRIAGLLRTKIKLPKQEGLKQGSLPQCFNRMMQWRPQKLSLQHVGQGLAALRQIDRHVVWRSMASLSTKGALFITLTCMIPVGTVGWYFIHETAASLTTAAIDKNNKVADRIASDVGNYLQNKKNFLMLTSGDAAIRSMQAESGKRYLDTVKPFLGGNETLFVARVDGQQILRTDSSQLVNIADREYFKLGMQGQAGFSEPLKSKVDGKLTIIGTAPIYGSDNKVTGLVGANIAMQNLTVMVEQVLSQNPGYGVTIISKNRVPLFHQGDSTAVEEQRALTEDFYQVAVTKQSGDTVGVLRGQDYFVSYRPIINTDWVAVTTYPKAVALQAAADMIDRGVQVTLLIIAGFVLVGLYFMKKALAPLKQLVAGVESVAQGDLTHRLQCQRRDEFGQVATAFNVMTEKLQQIVLSVKESAALVFDSSSSVATACTQSQTGSDQVAASVGDIAGKLSQQGKNTVGAKQSLEQLVEITETVALSIASTAQATNDCAAIADHGQGVINQTVDNMLSIKHLVDSAGRTVEELGNSTQEIGKISDVINSIASQTNLLALNAAIEAARAGEAGRGFAVVADEVRKLAEQSAKATKHITEITRKVTKETEGVLSAMQQSYRHVDQGVEIARTSGNAFANIVASVQGIQTQAAIISDQTEQQVLLCKKTMTAVADIHDLTAHNTDSAQDIAAISQEQAAAAHDIGHSIDKLKTMAHELEGLVDQFKI